MQALKYKVYNQQNSTRGLKGYLAKLGWTFSPEQEQAALRLLIPLTFLAYLLFSEGTQSVSNDSLKISINFISTFLGIATALFISSLILSTPSTSLRMIGMIVDIGALSLGLAITGETGAPWYGVYLWVTLGNGFRYGEKYLYISTTFSIIGFTFATVLNDYWTYHSSLAIGLAITLFVIPAYSSILIRRLNEARQRADAASRAKSDFLSCMSHEIRTPLNGILGMTELLRLRPLSADDRDCVETIHASGQALSRQINEILDLSKIEAGKMTLESIEFDLHVLVSTTLRIFHVQALEKGLEINHFIDPSTPFLLQGDPHKVRQIITNLVGNALKFTTRGSITISIERLPDQGDRALLRFEVIDTGTGIPKDRQQAIFDPFTQASDSVMRNFGGTGLGTTICKNLVDLMEGRIGLLSEIEKGSTFWFEIPFMKVMASPERVTAWSKNVHAAYISSVEPDYDPVAQALLDWNFNLEVLTPSDNNQLTVDPGKHDLLIINLASGTELGRIVDCWSHEPESARMATILIAAPTSIAESIGNRENVYFLDDPSDHERLLNVIHTFSSHHAAEDSSAGTVANSHGTGTIARQLHVLVSDDNATNRIVMQRMLEKLGHRHTIVNGGESALHALEDGHFDAVIIDKNMPDMGGIEVFQAYSFANSGTPPVEFAILTADATEESRESCTAVGIRHFLTKPVSLASLDETLGKMCATSPAAAHDRKACTNSCTPAQERSPATTDFNEPDFDKLGELSGGDPAFIQGIVENFIEDTNDNLRAIEAAVAQGDWLKFRDLAHALKGSSLYLGLTRLATLSREAQGMSREVFASQGVAKVIELRKTADRAIDILTDKLAGNSPGRLTG